MRVKGNYKGDTTHAFRLLAGLGAQHERQNPQEFFL